ncbi:MAG TPA: YbjQ family protein [Gammaproteobacteria bacterium]|nr:YbjQ family protein [Gammaproteobacteria bacterium]
MQVTTGLTFEGNKIVEYKGVVRGICVRSPTIKQGFFGALKGIIGGNIGHYKVMCENARQQAYDEMVEHATDLSANAIISMRYNTADLSNKNLNATEVLCYGTAVVIREA